ncbi:MAG: hypothetical protein ACKPKO_05590, partial [Candidatus Fonsibacter sp.]
HSSTQRCMPCDLMVWVWFWSHLCRSGSNYFCAKNKSLLLANIANANANSDEKALVYFDHRPHSRDRRPLEYPIRICFRMANGVKKACGAQFP